MMAKPNEAEELARRVFRYAMCGIGLQIALFALFSLWDR